MENELRFYLDLMQKELMKEDALFTPTYIITAVKLPTGAIEIAVNNTSIIQKLEYILEAYDENMCLKTSPDIVMQNVMIV